MRDKQQRDSWFSDLSTWRQCLHNNVEHSAPYWHYIHLSFFAVSSVFSSMWLPIV